MPADWAILSTHEPLARRPLDRSTRPGAALAGRCASAAEGDPPSFRLGDAAAPLDYDLRLAIDPGAPRFAGEIRIHLRFARETRVLWLDAVGLDVDRAEISQGERRIAARALPPLF